MHVPKKWQTPFVLRQFPMYVVFYLERVHNHKANRGDETGLLMYCYAIAGDGCEFRCSNVAKGGARCAMFGHSRIYSAWADVFAAFVPNLFLGNMLTYVALLF